MEKKQNKMLTIIHGLFVLCKTDIFNDIADVTYSHAQC